MSRLFKLPRSLSPPPVLSPKSAPTHQNKQTHAPCTHARVTRLYDKYGVHKCSVCGNVPSIGWLYRCTQDTHGFLPESDFRNLPPEEAIFNNEDSLNSLSTSVSKNIRAGQYSPQQIRQLVQQKENVRLIVTGYDTRPTTANSNTESSMFSLLPQSTTFSTNMTDVSLDEELKRAYDWNALHKEWQSEDPPATKASSWNTLQKEWQANIPIPPREKAIAQPNLDLDLESLEPIKPPPCGFVVCAACRPTYRERALQPLDQILKNPKPAPPWELENRPVSDARIVSKIGLAKKIFHKSRKEDIDRSVSDYSDYQTSRHSENTHSCNHSIRQRTRFRDTVRNVIRRACNDQRLSIGDGAGNFKDKADTKDDSKLSRSDSAMSGRYSRPGIFSRRRHSAQPLPEVGRRPTITVVDNESLQNSLMHMLGANTPLPPSMPATPMLASFENVNDGKQEEAQENGEKNEEEKEKEFKPEDIITWR